MGAAKLIQLNGLRHLLNILSNPVAHTYTASQRSSHQRRKKKKKKEKKKKKKVTLVHSLAPDLTLTLTLNHLANKPQQITSALRTPFLASFLGLPRVTSQ